MNRKAFYVVCSVSAGLLLFGLITDFLLFNGSIQAIITVSDNYVSDLFAMIFTVATLSCTLLSIIVSASNGKVLGLELRTIVSLKSSPIKLKEMIVITLAIVAFSILALLLDFCNSITMLAISLVAFVIFYSASLCDLVFSQKKAKELVFTDIAEANRIMPHHVQCWITALFQAIEENDYASEDEYLNLIKAAVENSSEYKKQVGNHIPKLLDASCKHQSFIDSYKRVLRLNIPSKTTFDERKYTHDYITGLEYSDPGDIYRINIKGTIEDILWCEFLDDEEKSTYGYWFLYSVSKNRYLSENEKLNILYASFRQLVSSPSRDSEFKAGVDTAVYVFRNMVLLSDDFEYGRKIFSLLLKAVYVRNNYMSSVSAANLLAQVARMIYFWSKMETETISKPRRDLIASITSQHVDSSIDNVDISLGSLIEKHHDRMVEYLIKDSFNESFDILDYWSDTKSLKNVVVSPETKIQYALWFYLIWGYDYEVFPISKYVLTDSNDNRSLSKLVCTAALGEFLQKGTDISDRAKNGIDEIRAMFNKRNMLPPSYIVESYNVINQKVLELIEMEIMEAERIEAADIRAELEKIMKDSDIAIDKTMSLDSAQIVQLAPFVCYKDKAKMSFVTMNLKSEIIGLFEFLVSTRLPQELLSFDLAGVVRLIALLKTKEYRFRNYSFYDNWGFHPDVRSSEQMKELISLVNAIPLNTKHNIGEYVFLDVDDICLNYNIEDIVFDEIEGEALERHLSIYRTSNEQYNIDGGVYSKTEAIEHYQNTRWILRAKLKVETNVLSTSGFQVGFERPSCA